MNSSKNSRKDSAPRLGEGLSASANMAIAAATTAKGMKKRSQVEQATVFMALQTSAPLHSAFDSCRGLKTKLLVEIAS